MQVIMASMAPNTPPADPRMGTVLVIGGCGFLGYHLVQNLLRDDECGPVHVLDRSIENNRLADAAYTEGNISDKETIRKLVALLRPRVIFHAASPPASLPSHLKEDFYNTNVIGTQVLLDAAAEHESVRAFVYSSSVDTYADPPHDLVDESHPVWSPASKIAEYNRTKAIGDGLVREANGPQLRTVCLRLAHIYGDRHTQGLTQVLDSIKGDRPLVQIGDGTNLMEVLSADNAATAHLLAAKALLDPRRALDGGEVGGEAFNVSDGAPVPFWHHVRVIWGVARGEDALKKVTVLPAWAMGTLVFLATWSYWIFTLGTVEPPVALSKTSFAYVTTSHTYSIQKARARLGFSPVANHDEVLARSVQWELHRQSQLASVQ